MVFGQIDIRRNWRQLVPTFTTHIYFEMAESAIFVNLFLQGTDDRAANDLLLSLLYSHKEREDAK